MTESLRVRLLDENDADSIAEFIRAAEWDPAATVDDVRKMLRAAAEDNPFQPGIAPPRVGVFVGQRLAAYLTSIPTNPSGTARSTCLGTGSRGSGSCPNTGTGRLASCS